MTRVIRSALKYWFQNTVCFCSKWKLVKKWPGKQLKTTLHRLLLCLKYGKRWVICKWTIIRRHRLEYIIYFSNLFLSFFFIVKIATTTIRLNRTFFHRKKLSMRKNAKFSTYVYIYLICMFQSHVLFKQSQPMKRQENYVHKLVTYFLVHLVRILVHKLIFDTVLSSCRIRVHV